MKPCPACGGRNGERSQFCHVCGARLDAGKQESPLDQTGAADPLSASIYGAMPPMPPHGAQHAPTPIPEGSSTASVTASTCGACGYRLPPGQVVSWCPGCGRLFDDPVAGAASSDSGSVPPSAPVAARTPAPMERTITPLGVAVPASLPPPPGWNLVLLKAGERLDRFPLRKPDVILGRSEGDYNFPEDLLLSPRHAHLYCQGKSFWLQDAGSRNGTFIRLSVPEELRHEDVVTFGSLVFRYESAGGGTCTTSLITTEGGVKLFGSGRERARGRLVRILQDGSDGPAYPLAPTRTIVGRKLGHFLFPDDALLSRQHVQFYERDGEMWVEDLGSSNGTMLRLRAPAELSKGMVFRIGDVTLEVSAP